MSNKISEKLGLPYNKGALYTIGSNAAVGKTTLLCVLAAEYVKDGKNILFLSEDLDEKTLQKKLVKILKPEDVPEGVTFGIKHFFDFKEVIKQEFKDKKFDVVVIDGGFNVDYKFLHEISVTNNCLILTSFQTKRLIGPTPIADSNINYFSEVALGLFIKDEFTFLENLKYKVFFWLKKPNRTVKVLKNRYGSKDSSFDIHIDFENIKIN